MSEQLRSLELQLQTVETSLTEAEETQKNSAGPEKGAATKLINQLTDKKKEIETALIALPNSPYTESPDENGSGNPSENSSGNENLNEQLNESGSDNQAGDNVELQQKSAAPKKRKLEDIEDGEMVVVKNKGRFMLHNNDIRFSPDLEKRAEMNGFIRDQIEADIFLLLDK